MSDFDQLARRYIDHHDQLRFTCELDPADEQAPVAGFDIATLDADGRIRTVRGFLDGVPAAT